MSKTILISYVIISIFFLKACSNKTVDEQMLTITKDDGTRLLLEKSDLKAGTHHLNHRDIFGKYSNGYNLKILEAIDIVQATSMDGGGYFASIKAVPPEAPVGYPLKIFNKVLFDPQRPTSYCSGSTYAAFIESINLMFKGREEELPYPQFEALCMQEPDGGRREDTIKFWGKWNDDGYGNHFALVQYSKMGKKLIPFMPDLGIL